MGAIATWMEIHDDLEGALRDVRRIWPERDPARQRRALRQLAEPLRLHIRLEDEQLMPLYEELAADLPPNGAPHVFAADHARLAGLLDELEAGIGGTDLLGEQERLCRLAGVLEHHDLRERTWFVPALDAHLAPSHAARLVEEFAAAAAELPAPEPLAPQPAPPPPDPGALQPVDALRLQIACDGDVASALAAVEIPDHPRGPRRMAHCEALVDAMDAASSLGERRDRLADLADAARLLAIVARTQSRRGAGA